jgi:hypothetical protein
LQHSKALPAQVIRDMYLAIKGSNYSEKVEYTPIERIFRGLGFTPAREAQKGEFSRAFNTAKEEHCYERSQLIQSYTKAKEFSERLKALNKIRQWNLNQPHEAQIATSVLNSALRAKQNDADVSAGRSSKSLLERQSRLYPDMQ